MIRLTSAEILALLNRREAGWARAAENMPAWSATGVSTDSRSVRPGELFAVSYTHLGRSRPMSRGKTREQTGS